MSVRRAKGDQASKARRVPNVPGWVHQELDSRVERALQEGLADYRAAAAPPEFENIFEAGFFACAVAFWDPLTAQIAREWRQHGAARKGGKVRAESIADEMKSFQVAASRLRRMDPDASTRELARRLAQRFELKPSGALDRLRKLGIK